MARGKKKAPPPAKPGIAHQHLLDHYDCTPETQKLKIGHVLRLYLESDKCVAETIRAVYKLHVLPCTGTITDNDMKPLIKKYENFRHLSREKEKQDYVEFCDQPFTSFRVQPAAPNSTENPNTCTVQAVSPNINHGPSTSSSCEPTTPDVDIPSPDVSSSGSARLRSYNVSPRKLKLKQRLNFVSQKRSCERKQYKKRTKELKQKVNISKVIKVKYLNQNIKRKNDSLDKRDATIASLKAQIQQLKQQQATPNKGICVSDPSSEEKLKKITRTHKRLKEANKQKRKKKRDTVSKEKYMKLKQQFDAIDQLNKKYENDICELRERLEETDKEKLDNEKVTKVDGKSYNSETRLFVFDCIVNQVPTQNIPTLMESFAQRQGQTLSSVPHRTTVEQMARELSSIADLKSAKLAMRTKNLTVGFDATTQEGVHINSIHLTTEAECDVIAVDELAGGTADDYCNHITMSVDHLADVYADYHKDDFQFCRSTMIANITNTMNDRVAANHAAINKVNEAWDKTLNELNCHLHPLDTIASTCRSTLKSSETDVHSSLYGKDCIAANLVVQINKYRYKDGKGDPRGFKAFLNSNNLPLGLIPRYRGNRLHILFHITGKLIEHYPLFLDFFRNATVSCGGLLTSIRKDFENKHGILQMQVLGLIGKFLTGPWMTVFYTGVEEQLSHIDGIGVVKKVVATLEAVAANPQDVLVRSTDFFGRELATSDQTLKALRQKPADTSLFDKLMSACLLAVVKVLMRQYKRYFELDITDQLRDETKSARSHNIDSESIMGMFSAGQERAKNASVDFLTARMRARKNNVVTWLNNLYTEERENIMKWAVGRGRKRRKESRKKTSEVKAEILRRIASKQQKKDEKTRKSIEKKLKQIDTKDVQTSFPNLTDEVCSLVIDILCGRVVGRKIHHIWYEEGTTKLYGGKIEKLKKNNKEYVIAYWLADEETYSDAIDYDISRLQLAADLICEDVIMC